jgi:hypothetical protein
LSSNSRRLLNQSTRSSEAAPWVSPMDHFGLVEAVDRFGESICHNCFADTADGRLDAGRAQALDVSHADVLRTSPNDARGWPYGKAAFVQGLLQRIEHEAGACRPGDASADDAAGVGVDDESHVDEARPGADIGEVRDPQRVRRRGMEDPVHMIERARAALSCTVVRMGLPRRTP